MQFNFKLNTSCVILNRILKHSFYPYQVNSFRVKSNNNLKEKENFNPFKNKVRFKNYQDPKIVTRLLITILGNGAIGQPRCLALFTDFKAFIFNCGEGVGRLCREYEIPFNLLRHVFITQRKWENMSGLHDVYLTNEVFGCKSMSIYGPPGVEGFTSLITASRMDLALIKRDGYVSETLEISHIPIKSRVARKNSKFNLKHREEGVVYSYVCKIPKKLGDFNPEKCVDHGVPFGNHLLKLTNGEDVTLPDGRVIYSSDVLDPLQPARSFLVVDCPSEEFLDSFVNEDQFSQFQLPAENASDINFVFHFSPPNIVNTTKYQSWLQNFHQNTEHYMLNSSNPSLSSEAVYQTQNILHLVHPEIFKVLPMEDKPTSSNIARSPNIVHPPPMLQLLLRPEKKLSRLHVVSHKSENFNEVLTQFPDFKDELFKLRNVVSSLDVPKEINNYPEVLFLGTSSTTSTACRNVSAILVTIEPSISILLDCGEGTVKQLVRYFGKAYVDSILQNITCVFITHKHTDHYMGLFEFLEARKKAFENSKAAYKPVALILPYQIHDIYHRYCQLFQVSRIEQRIFSCKNLASSTGNDDSLKDFIGDVKLQTVPVQHCPDAHGIVLQLGSKWKIVYSGDTAPCQALVTAGKNCTLLIHEASIESGLLSEASSKLHSTPSQVADIAERMNAQHTIMTHFSKRYLAVPIFHTYNDRSIGYAFDFMKVRLHELRLLPLLLPALKCLFQVQLDDHVARSSSAVNFDNVFLKSFRSYKNR